MKTFLVALLCLLTTAAGAQAKSPSGPVLPGGLSFGDSFAAVDKKLKGKSVLNKDFASPEDYNASNSEADLPYENFSYNGATGTLNLNFTYGKLTSVEFSYRNHPYDYRALLTGLTAQLGAQPSCNKGLLSTECTWAIGGIDITCQHDDEKSNAPDAGYSIRFVNGPLQEKLGNEPH